MNNIVKKLSLLLVVLTVSTGCKKTVTLEHTFENGLWKKFEPVRFQFPSPNNSSPYHIQLIVNYQENFPSPDLPLYITLKSPAGDERIQEKRIWLKSLDHKPKGEWNGSCYSLETTIFYELYANKKGTLELTVESDHPKFEAGGMVSMQAKLVPGKLTPPKPGAHPQ